MSESMPSLSERTATNLRALAVYGERRVLVMLLLGFAAGLPFLLIFDTLSVWLRQSGLSLQSISIFALATLTLSPSSLSGHRSLTGCGCLFWTACSVRDAHGCWPCNWWSWAGCG